MVWKQVPVGPATENARRPNVLRRWPGTVSWQRLDNVVADDWLCLKLERSSLPHTVALCCGDIVGLLVYKMYVCRSSSVTLVYYDNVTEAVLLKTSKVSQLFA